MLRTLQGFHYSPPRTPLLFLKSLAANPLPTIHVFPPTKKLNEDPDLVTFKIFTEDQIQIIINVVYSCHDLISVHVSLEQNTI